MSISTTNCKRTYQTDGETRAWSLDFPVLTAADIQIYVTASDGTQTRITTGYEVDLLENQVIYPTVASGLSALSAGQKITLVRVTDLTQAIHLTQQGTLDAGVLEGGYDKLTLQVQELAERTERCIKYPVSSAKTGADADTFLAELASAQATALSGALDSVAETKAELEQTVADEATAREQADTTLQTAINAKQNALSSAQQNAVNSGITTAKVSAYEAHLVNTSNPHSVTKAQLGLGNVDNTADADKPVSTAMQTALAAKQDAGDYVTNTALTTALAAKQDTGDYATNTALTTGLAAKQDSLTTAQLAAANSGVTTTIVAQVQTNQEDIAALDEELAQDRPWQPPTGWVDIRNGAIPNSVYYFVGHSADYSTYPKFAVSATVSNSGTYDVYVDGIKQATTASGSSTELDWQTLALSSGWDVTYPATLRAHIVRVTPSSDANKFTEVRCANPAGTGTSSSNEPQLGVLWCHYALDYVIKTSNAFAQYPWGYWNPDLIAVTAQGDVLKTSSIYSFLGKGVDRYTRGSSKIEYLPIFDFNSSQANATGAFCCNNSGVANTALKKIRLQNGVVVGAGKSFGYMNNLTEIECKNASLLINGETFWHLPKLKKLPSVIFYTSYGTPLYDSFVGLDAITDTLLDVSYHTTMTKLKVGGSSSYPIRGIKWITVSSSAPFTGASPQIDVSYLGLNRSALVQLFKSLPTVSDSQVCNIIGCSGGSDLDTTDLAIATGKGWTVTR